MRLESEVKAIFLEDCGKLLPIEVQTKLSFSKSRKIIEEGIEKFLSDEDCQIFGITFDKDSYNIVMPEYGSISHLDYSHKLEELYKGQHLMLTIC